MSMFLDNKAIERARKLGYPIYVCPNTNESLMGLPDDDKVICSCSKPNSNAPQGVQDVEQRSRVHVVAYLKKA